MLQTQNIQPLNIFKILITNNINPTTGKEIPMNLIGQVLEIDSYYKNDKGKWTIECILDDGEGITRYTENGILTTISETPEPEIGEIIQIRYTINTSKKPELKEFLGLNGIIKEIKENTIIVFTPKNNKLIEIQKDEYTTYKQYTKDSILWKLPEMTIQYPEISKLYKQIYETTKAKQLKSWVLDKTPVAEMINEEITIITDITETNRTSNNNTYRIQMMKDYGQIINKISINKIIMTQAEIPHETIKINRKRIGYYIRKRNTIILETNIFSIIIETEEDRIETIKLLTDILKSIQEISPEKNQEAQKEIEQIQITKLTAEMCKRIIQTKKQEETLRTTIENYQEGIAESMTKLEYEKEILELLTKKVMDTKKYITEQIEQLKKLEFVKDARITTKGIEIEYGDIYITTRINTTDYQEEVKTIYIGDITATIDQQKIKIKNKYPLSGYHHPHVSQDGKPCYGSSAKTIINIITTFNLIKTAIWLNTYLKTITRGSEHYNATAWYKHREEMTKEELIAKKIIQERW